MAHGRANALGPNPVTARIAAILATLREWLSPADLHEIEEDE